VNQEPQGVDRERANRDSKDGLAAIAIALLTIALIVLLVSKIT
jgi:hypothetical protein